MKTIPLIFTFLCVSVLMSHGQEDLSLRYEGKATTALVGDGKFIVKTTPERFLAARGLVLDGQFRFYSGNDEILPSSHLWNSTIFPGGALYDIKTGSDSIFVLYGATGHTGFITCIKTPVWIKVKLYQSNSAPLFCKEVQDRNIRYTFFMQKDIVPPAKALNELKDLLQEPYKQQLVLKSPNEVLNKAVAFSQYLLDLGYNGEIIFCELFRWLDIWARDLGSGLLPGGLVSGREVMARNSLTYDLKRYASMSPEYCKNSNDPSQGGTSAEVGWTVRSCWNYYMFSGDLELLRKDAEMIRPWVAHWIERDYDEDGLIVDVTEFMDHMLMMVTTNGVSTLATNVMYSALLDYSSKIEAELGNRKEAQKLKKLHEKTINAINTVYWNERKEYFNNMALWGVVSERSSQTFQSLLLKMNATDDLRAEKALSYLKKENWCDYGSITITPRMNHVPLTNDQNVKVWPWWNLWEVEARFRHNDKKGGYHLLNLAAKTIEDEKYPGLIEETLDIDGTSIGGNVFMTAAGNLLEVIVKDLLGIETLIPGWAKIKVVPSVPDEWRDYECKTPTPNGFLNLYCKDGNLTIEVNDDKIKEVFVENIEKTNVIGAEKKQYLPVVIESRKYVPTTKKTAPSISGGKAVMFYDKEFHANKPSINLDAVDVDALESLSASSCKKVIISGNRLPLYTKDGKSIKKALEKYVNNGGIIIFYGASANAKNDENGAGILGENCGLIDWYQYLPDREKTFLTNWTFSPASTNVSTEQKTGNYTTVFDMKVLDERKDIYIELGPLIGSDSVFINDKHVANFSDMEKFIKQEYPTTTRYPDMYRYKMLSRIYVLKAGSEGHKALQFNGKNTISVKLYDDGMNFGFPADNKPNIGVITNTKSWQATDDAIPDIGLQNPRRKGVNYWGNEQFFNSWSTKNGMFGFAIEGSGVQFCDGTALEGLENLNIPVNATYTDYPLFKPWIFEILAYTTTQQQLLYPMTEERYPCVVRIVNTKTNGGYILINPSIANNPAGLQVLKKLKVGME